MPLRCASSQLIHHLETTAGAHEHEEEIQPPANETEETDVDQTVSSTCNGQDETENSLGRANGSRTASLALTSAPS